MATVRIGLVEDHPVGAWSHAPTHQAIEVPFGPVAVHQVDNPAAQELPSALAHVMAALVVLLHRYTAQPTIVLGISAEPFDHDGHRFRTECFDVLPLAVPVDPAQSFAEVLASTKAAMRILSQCPARLEPPEGNGSHEQSGSLQFHAIVLPPAETTARFDTETARIRFTSVDELLRATDLYIGLAGTGASTLTVGFDRSRFDPERMQRFGRQLEKTLGDGQSDMSRLVREIDILPADERRELLVASNGLPVPLPDRTIVDLVEEQCRRSPDRVAVTCQGLSLTYADIWGKADTLASELERLSITRGTIVPLLLDRSFDLIVSALALMKLGAVFVPLDVTWPASRLRSMIEDLAPKLVLTDQAFRPPFPLSCATLSVDAATLQVASDSRRNRVDLNDPIYGFYTSGSTGTPKCAINIHRGILNRFLYMNKRYGAERTHVILQNSKHVFDAWVWQIFWPMTNGARVIVPESRRVFDLLSAIDLIDTYKVTMTDFVPSVFNAFVDYIRHADPDKRRRLQTLRHILMGGEEMNPEAVYRFRQMLPDCNITNTYGPTETSIGVIFFEVGDERYASVPIGKPIDNVSALLLDDRLNPVPHGVEGEVYIGGECVGLGYLNDPARTRAAFVDNPFPEVPSKHLYRTGDLGYRLADGNIRFLGRRDHQVKLHGVRIELGEIEAALRGIPEITDAKVLLHKLSGKQDFLVAYLATTSRSIDVPTVKRHLQERLPIYMVPARVVMLNTMPRDHNGKADRKALMAIPLPEAGEATREGADRARSREEQLLTQVWKDALGVSDVGLNDNFFDLGGDSLTAVRLLCGIREHLAIEVPLHRLYASPTIAEQLTLINSLSRAVPLQPLDATSVLSVQPDVTLADNILLEHPYEPVDAFRNVFITGASGFVGAHLLAEVLAESDATVHCLVRARNKEDAFRRIEEALSQYGLQHADRKGRIVAVPGNLALPSFGLDTPAYNDLVDQVDTVFHSAAMVDYFRSYSDHRSSNVLGSLEILRFAALGSPKRVHYISTLGVFPFAPDVRGVKMFGEADGMDDEFFPQDGYSQSKWGAEKLVERARANGLRIGLFRLGEVMPSKKTGIPNERAASHRVISGLVKLGMCPRSEAILDYVPVDDVSRAVVGIARHPKWTGASFNIRHPRGVPFSAIGDVLRSHGLTLREVTDAEFGEELDRRSRAEVVDADLILLKSLFARHEQRAGKGRRHDVLNELFYMDFTRVVNTAASLALADCGATFSTDGHSLLDAYAHYCKLRV